jgi:L-ascorbate metabolism protein UlaG (beta-lactamase superfamily)
VSTDIRFLGTAGYEIVADGIRVLIDPFLDGSPLRPCFSDDLEPPSVILVTHAAFDHFGDAAAIATRTGAPVVCGGEVRHLLLAAGVLDEQIRVTVPGVRVRVGGLEVLPVECRHWSGAVHPELGLISGPPMGYLVEPEPGVRIYHFGDTALFDMSLIGRLWSPLVGILGCTQPWEVDDPGAGEVLTGEMNPAEAALAAEMLGVRVAIASHYLTPNQDTERFVEEVKLADSTGRRAAVVPQLGQVVRVTPDGSATCLDGIAADPATAGRAVEGPDGAAATQTA